MFFDILLFNTTSDKIESLNSLAIETNSGHKVKISKQGIDKRFNEKSLLFIKTVFEKYLVSQFSYLKIEDGWLANFKHVRIKDGTRFDLPEAFCKMMPGSGGCASKAGVCLQYEFDIKSGKILDLSITPANRPDCADARDTKDNIESGDLVIRDLGYFVLESFESIIRNKAYIISRLNSNVKVYTQENKPKELDFEKIYLQMRQNNMERIEIPVYISQKALLPMRLIIELVPDKVYEERIRKLKKTNKKKGRQTTEKSAIRARFSLFITNICEKEIPAKAISALYHLRWQIELVFKIWKSTFGIHKTRKMKYNRWLCLLYAKLLIVVINWEIIMQHRSKLYKAIGKLLSMDKCMKTMKTHFHKIRNTIKNNKGEIKQTLEEITELLDTNHWLEKKKYKMNYEEILYLLYCKSKLYVYI
jgi:hypothetical protein